MPIQIRIRISMLMPIQIRMDPDWDQHDADPHTDPTPSFTHVGKSEFFSFSHKSFSRQALDADHDPDPAKLCGSVRIRMYNTGVQCTDVSSFFSSLGFSFMRMYVQYVTVLFPYPYL